MKRNLIVSHGDGDGVISTALLAEKHKLNLQETDIVFTQPFLVDKVKTDGYEQIYVCDLAINNRNLNMTWDFIQAIEDRLVVWYDHHEGWTDENVWSTKHKVDIGNSSCAALIGGDQKWIDAADAIDSRKGHSDLGQLLDQALKVNLSDNEVREYAFNYVLGLNNGSLLEKKQKEYETIQEKTRQLVNSGEAKGQVLVVNAQGHIGFDRTQIFMMGYEKAPFVVVLGEFQDKVTTTVATNTKTNLVKVFNLGSGSPFRVSFEGDHVERVVNTLNSLQD